ncbi:DinB family protein [Flavobacterium sp. Fl-77]|uniref:DinB family protein n=1 Tax=Flavobacterium flavipigmentatum TaxID=2893884 RepID=A0AAJ2VYJ7_9FLAO|nr:MULTISPECIES: DinB family protein [unclassified Flavobacterium]MDX6182861.1 DinB family protein [Flavobacterium sp. Fl-33]MDX6186314.1 DinB family protein [Flavobacterium sp. Fl-77]UFH37897.1 DinB family protein [Flavobacterium sp. F-70]
MTTSDLLENEYSGGFTNYIREAGDTTLIEELEISLHQFIKFVQNIPMHKFDYRYAEGKWTIKDIIQHIIDCERIFAYRALRFSRNDNTSLPSFDEDSYANSTNSNNRSIQDLLTEFSALRHSNLLFYKSLSEEQLKRIGTASNNNISVRALGFVIIGHQKHHQKVFEERYL